MKHGVLPANWPPNTAFLLAHRAGPYIRTGVTGDCIVLSILILTLMAQFGADDSSYLDAPIIQNAVPTAEPGRFESPKPYDETLQHYKWYFKSRGGVRWRNIVNLPQIRAKHIQSLRPKTKWQGLNIYEKQGKVRIFVVPRDLETDAAPAPKK